MKSILIFIFFSSIMYVYAQSITINNQITEKHTLIRQTKASILVPNGFTESQKFKGFTKNDNFSNLVVSTVPVSYDSVCKQDMRKSFQQKGIEVFQREDISFQGKPALWINYLQPHPYEDVNIATNMLVFGDSASTIFILTTCDASDKATYQSLKEALLSTVYQPNLVLNDWEKATFSIDYKENGLKYDGQLNNLFTFTPLEKTDLANFQLSVGEVYDQPINSKSEFCNMAMLLVSLKSAPNMKIQSEKSIEVSGMEGCETISYDETTHISTYLVVLFGKTVNNQQSYYMIMGTSKDKSEQAIEFSRKVVHTFRLK